MFIPLSKPTNEFKFINEFEKKFLNELYKGIFVGGFRVEEFEFELKKFFNSKYAITLNSGTDALIFSLIALGVKKGDEVILPSFTYFATVEAVMHVGAIPVFADLDNNSFCISAKTVESLISKRTKCIIPVHLYGYNSDIEQIINLAKYYNIFVVEDVAQAFGSKSKNKFLGTFGDTGAFSNFPSKTLGGIGDGGFVLTNNKTLFNKISMYKNHGQKITYEHYIKGTNSRLDSLNAYVLTNKLKNFNKIKNTRNNFLNFYLNFFKNIESVFIPKINKDLVMNYFTIVLNELSRDSILASLKNANIQSNIYYKKPLHKQKAVIDYGFKGENLVNTENYSKNVISLPLYANVTNGEILYLEKKLKKIFNYV